MAGASHAALSAFLGDFDGPTVMGVASRPAMQAVVHAHVASAPTAGSAEALASKNTSASTAGAPAAQLHDTLDASALPEQDSRPSDVQCKLVCTASGGTAGEHAAAVNTQEFMAAIDTPEDLAKFLQTDGVEVEPQDVQALHDLLNSFRNGTFAEKDALLRFAQKLDQDLGHAEGAGDTPLNMELMNAQVTAAGLDLHFSMLKKLGTGFFVAGASFSKMFGLLIVGYLAYTSMQVASAVDEQKKRDGGRS